jgi:hypothetical protein
MFARSRNQPLMDVMEKWHPRDLDTWLELDAMEAEEGRFAELRQEHREAQGR